MNWRNVAHLTVGAEDEESVVGLGELALELGQAHSATSDSPDGLGRLGREIALESFASAREGE